MQIYVYYFHIIDFHNSTILICSNNKSGRVRGTEPAPQGQFETSQLELSLKSHAFEKFVYLHIHSLVRRPAHKYERNSLDF